MALNEKKDAEYAYHKYLEDNPVTNLSNVCLNNIERRLKDYVAEFYNYKKSKLKESSMVEIYSIFKLYILPTLGNEKIKNITKIKVLQWQNSLNNHSYAYKCKIRTMLYSFYRYLNLYYDIDNVVARVENFTPPKVKTEMEFWTQEEFNSFINAFEEKDYMWYVFFNLYIIPAVGLEKYEP